MELTKEQTAKLPPKPQRDDYATEEEFDECLGWWFHRIQPMLLGMSTASEDTQEVTDKENTPGCRYSAHNHYKEVTDNIKSLERSARQLKVILDDLKLVRQSHKEVEMDPDKLTDLLLGIESLYSLKFDRFEKSLEVVIDYSLDKLGYVDCDDY